MDRYLRRQIVIILYLIGLIVVMLFGYYAGKHEAMEQINETYVLRLETIKH